MSEKSFNISRIYVKDTSVEMPMGAKIFINPEAPALSLNLAVEASPLEPDVFEVAIRGTLKAELQGSTAYLVEVQQAGIFQITGYSPEETQAILQNSCPNILYPYLRSNIAQQLTAMTVPVFYLPELNINFEAANAEAADAQNT